MKEDIPENVKKLAEALKKSGLAASDSEAIEKAKASLKAQEIVKKAQDIDNYFTSQKDMAVKEMLKDRENMEKLEEEKTSKVSEKEKEEGANQKESIKIKEISSVDEEESEKESLEGNEEE